MGSLEKSFSRFPGFNNRVNSVVLLPDGGIIAGGNFTTYQGIPRLRIAKLKADGSLDTTFDSSSGFNGNIISLAIHPDGGVIAGGFFTTYGVTARQSIAKLNGTTAALDTTFDSSSGFNNSVTSLAIHPDGGVIAGGFFTTYGVTPRQRIAKLDGTTAALDTTFDSSSGFSGSVFSLAIHPDGGVITGGFFSTYGVTARQSIAKLDGTTAALDTTFDSSSGFSGFVFSLAIHPDGEVIVGGSFSDYKGTTRQRIAKLDGKTAALDTTFDSSSGFNFFVEALAIHPDGGVIAGGDFTTYGGVTREHIAKLNGTTAALDTTFDPGNGFGGFVLSLALQPNGKIVVGGDFFFYQGFLTQNIARLYGSPLKSAVGESFAFRKSLKVGDIIVGNNFTIPSGDTPAQEPGSICLDITRILIRKLDGSVGIIGLT